MENATEHLDPFSLSLRLSNTPTGLSRHLIHALPMCHGPARTNACFSLTCSSWTSPLFSVAWQHSGDDGPADYREEKAGKWQ